MKHTISPFLLPDLFFAGRAVLTFNNENKGTHMTVKIKQARDKFDAKKKLPIFFVYISLLGDGEQGMIFAGTIFKESGHVKLGAKVHPTSRLARAMAFMSAALKDTSILKKHNVTVQHEGKCATCAMPLTHPSSIPVGFGPDCLKKKMADPDFANIFRLSFPDFKY
jgi:hypothetical protein